VALYDWDLVGRTALSRQIRVCHAQALSSTTNAGALEHVPGASCVAQRDHRLAVVDGRLRGAALKGSGVPDIEHELAAERERAMRGTKASQSGASIEQTVERVVRQEHAFEALRKFEVTHVTGH